MKYHRTKWLNYILISYFSGIDDDDSAVEDITQPAEEDMPVLEGDDDSSRMEEVD